MANYINGKDLLLYHDNKIVAAATTCEAVEEAEIAEQANMYSGLWRAYKTTRKGWRMSHQGLVAVGSVKDWSSLVGHTIFVQFRTRTGFDDCLCGYAIVTKLSVSGQVGSLGKISVDLVGTGALSNVVPKQYLRTNADELFVDNADKAVTVAYE